MLADQGGSFACGVMRIVSMVSLVMYLTAFSYALFTVWSRCLELQLGGSAPSLEGLLGQARHDEAMAYSKRDGLFGTGPRPKESLPAVYGSLASPEVGGGTTIFGGDQHAWVPRSRCA